ncbi:primosomal replication protein PriC [Gallibacterium melopsittaci]|uniref:Primosomal replication protein PriC n=1 Tax=Gallibacterium melopsittaci TaxID=516063 RepID=A0ABV6HW88_9PAST
MSTPHQHLVQQLLKQLEHFSRYDSRQLLTVAFEPTIFFESFQPLGFYLDEIQQNIEKLAQVENVQVIDYLAEKITTQFRVLFDALNLEQTAQTHNPIAQSSPQKTANTKDKNAVFHLPPEQRIHKYYEFLTRFNDQLAYLEQQQQQTTDPQQKAFYQQHIIHYQQRRERCLAAIEQLEEYLEFKSQQQES